MHLKTRISIIIISKGNFTIVAIHKVIRKYNKGNIKQI